MNYLLSDMYNHKVYGGEIKDPLLPLSRVKSGENDKRDEHYVIDFGVWVLLSHLPLSLFW